MLALKFSFLARCIFLPSSVFPIFLAMRLVLLWQDAVLVLDDAGLDIDQVENLIKFCPTKEEMELLKVGSGKHDLHSFLIQEIINCICMHM